MCAFWDKTGIQQDQSSSTSSRFSRSFREQRRARESPEEDTGQRQSARPPNLQVNQPIEDQPLRAVLGIHCVERKRDSVC